MKDQTRLAVYAREDLRGDPVDDRYRPKRHVLRQVVALLPRAHVVVVSGTWCSDCRREVPKFARIAERLPGWTLELRGDDAETRQLLKVRKIPTFIVQHPDTGEELGRIVESPESDALEADLLAIAERHPTRIIA